MPGERKQPEPEQQAGAPEWMVTFSDCMTLLLTFFVLLLSFSSFDNDDDFHKMSTSMAYQFSFDTQSRVEEDAVVDPVKINQDLHWGSEKPTLSDGMRDLFKKKTKPADFLRLNTFLISSDKIFWGNGSEISANGRKVLTDLALFLKEFPDYFVIVSESGPEKAKDAKDICFDRAWSVFNYLTAAKGVDRQQLNISASGTVAKECHINKARQGMDAAQDRILEIVLLKRSI